MDYKSLLAEVRELRNRLASIEKQIQQSAGRSRERIQHAPLYGRNAQRGLHTLMSHWPRFTYLREQCNHIRESLSDAIEATRRASPTRSVDQGFRLLSPSGRISLDEMDASSGERRLENALFQRWELSAKHGKVENLWLGLAGKQIPLFDNRERNGFGHIDLIGVDESTHHPIIVELKKGDNKECLLRPLLEGVTYAIALKKVWRNFVDEYAELLDGQGLEIVPESSWESQKIVVMAPKDYWQYWMRQRRRLGNLDPMWTSFRDLTNALRSNYRISVDFWQCPSLRPDGQLENDQLQPAMGPWNKN